MNVRKLLDWRKALIYTHRWMGIVGALVFVAWFISGIVFAFRNMPTFSTSERLRLLAPLDLSTARVEPLEAARILRIKPSRLRIGMYYDRRPVYRFQGTSIIYADTGEAIPGRDANQALDFVRWLEPSHAATVRYDSLLNDSDLWTAGGGVRAQMPLHKVALGDSAGTYYYISQKTGEPVMKTDRASRFWGFWGPVLHQFYFTSLRLHNDLWGKIILWSSITGSLMCLSGLVAGVWRFSISSRFRQKGEHSHTPYSGWMRWHHYAGLLFGVLSLTWIFSGGLAFDSFNLGSDTNPTVQQRNAATGGPLNLKPVTLEGLRRGIAAIAPSFTPKEADVQQFRGELYLIAADGPPERYLIGITERPSSTTPVEFRMAWLAHPEKGAFTRFDDAAMMDIAHEAMPSIAIRQAEWMSEYDNYYRSRLAQLPLPVLRVRYADPEETWLYLDPFRGLVAWREEWSSRRQRWLYNGLHKFDLPFVYDHRPLWDISIVVLSLGGLILSITPLVAAYRRLRRHARSLVRTSPEKVESRLS